MPERLTGCPSTSLRARILKRLARTYCQSVYGAALRHLRGPPRKIAAHLLVTPRRGRGRLQLRGEILRRAGRAILLQRVAADLPNPVLGRRRGDEVTDARIVFAGYGGDRRIAGAIPYVDSYPRRRLLIHVQ